MLKPTFSIPKLSRCSPARHTNTVVIANRDSLLWPMIQTVDFSLVHDLPTVLAVLPALRLNFQVGKARMARKFLNLTTLKPVPRLPPRCKESSCFTNSHGEFNSNAIGFIRTGDTTPYADIIVENT